MSNINIYEDQENRVPVGLHDRGIPHKHGESYAGRNQQINTSRNQSIHSNVLQSQRTVLSSISINSNIRIQPRRAAKQGISYESGIPTHLPVDEKTIDKRTKSYSGNSNSTSSLVPSFHIHEDDSSSSCSSLSSSSSSWLQTLAPSCTSETSSFMKSSEGVLNPSDNPPRAKLKELRNVEQSPVKNRSKVTKVRDVEAKSLHIKSSQHAETPEAMDISVTEAGGSTMAIDTPTIVSSVPKEDILEKKENEFCDVQEYAEDIYNYLREAEICHKPRVNYMLKQADITASMRWILVDWLVEVSEEYTLHTETLYLAISYIDRFLSHMSVKRDKLQLVGTTAMFIASKYEEIYPPDVSQFAYITDNTYRVSQILRMEHLILKVLSFDMAIPTALFFINYYSKICKCDEATLHLAMFISELSMLDSDPFLRYLPSKIGASSIALANFTQGREAWPEAVVVKSRYSLDDLRECYVNLHRSFCRVNEPSQHAIRDKYKATKWHNVSTLSPREKFPW